jgi:hypothetical protein
VAGGEAVEIEDVRPVGAGAGQPVKEKERLAVSSLVDVELRGVRCRCGDRVRRR